MKFVFNEDYGGYFAQVLDDQDDRDHAWVEGTLDGIMFRQHEVRYDGLPCWRCLDCGARVFAGRREAEKQPTAFVELYRRQRCMACAVAAENSVLEQEGP